MDGEYKHLLQRENCASQEGWIYHSTISAKVEKGKERGLAVVG
jgi:hypothetical protein